MSRKSKNLPTVPMTLPNKPRKSKKLIRLIVVTGIVATGVHVIRKYLKKQNELINDPNFHGNSYITRFNGREICIPEGEPVPNMKLLIQFGGVSIDISKAQITKDICFEVQAFCSGLSIRIPEGINVQADFTSTASGVSIPQNQYDDAPTLYLYGTNRCSGICVYTKPEN